VARLDVYKADSGFWLDCQSDVLAGLNSRFVVPLIPLSEKLGIDPRLTPTFEIDDVVCIMQTHLAGAVPARLLRSPVANLVDHEYVIGAALDMLVGRY
jgi:hypothetical protein